MNVKRACLSAMVLALLLAERPSAQMRVRPIDLEEGTVQLGLVLRHLANTGVFMQATAHPDDETNALHVLLNRGRGTRTVLATATRGDGGQNEIGSEIFDALAVLRTEELAAVHRFDGTEQYFTRAVDFGYSFSVEETLEKWGRDEIVSDYVRLIRSTRPDVIVGMSPLGTGGGLHHQASGLLSREAFYAAADPSRYPDQIKAGLRPWQAKKFYYTASFGTQPSTSFRDSADFTGAGVAPAAGGVHAQPASSLKLTTVDTSGYDPLLGRTFAEIGAEERSMHKCQALPQLLGLPGPSQARLNLMDSYVGVVNGDERSLFDGIDTSIVGLARQVQAPPPQSLVTGLQAISDRVAEAQKRFDFEPSSAAEPIVAGLGAVRSLRQRLNGLGLSGDDRFNIDARLKTKEDEFSQAAVLAHGLRIEALADDGLVVPTGSVRISVIVGDRGQQPVNVGSVALSGFDGAAACAPAALQAGGVYKCDSTVKIPADAKPTKPYWKRLPNAARYEVEPDAPFGLPFRPTPFRASITLTLSGADVHVELPIQYRYEGKALEGEKRMELTVVPRIALRVNPDIAIVPAGRAATAAIDREVRVTVTNNDKAATAGQVKLEVPAGWRVTPATTSVNLAREDEAQTVRFTLRPSASTALGQYPVRAVATSGAQTFETGYQVVEYPHIHRRQLEIPAGVSVKVMDVRLAPNLSVGYVMGSGDEVPAALRGLGASVSMLGPDELAWGDLGRFDAIVIGIRAYDGREDLQANNTRVLEYARNGGTVIVQYNRDADWAQYAPFPARSSATRVTDENGQVQILASDDPVFHYPNEIGAAAWRGWVQERGTYFIEAQSPQYTELIQVNEPFENNVGWKKGALVQAAVGKGRWIYVGLGLWRQLAAGTDGAYQLFANLISRGKLPGAPAQR